MKDPDSILSILASILCALGAVMLLCAVLVPALNIPMRSGEAWMFLPTGGALLLAGCVCGLLELRNRSRRARLIAKGQAVLGRAVSVRRHLYIAVGMDADGIHTRNPWSLECEYTWAGHTYTVRSALLWSKPRESMPLTVFLDPNHPKRAVVDTQSIHFVH